MSKTNFIENLQKIDNLDTTLTGDYSIQQKDQITKIVLLDKENRNEFIADDVEITYSKELDLEDRSEYEDENGNKGYKQIYEFTASEFAGTIATVALASKDFVDPRFLPSYNNTSGAGLNFGGVFYAFSANDMINPYTRVLDIDYENGELLTFNIRYVDDAWTAAFCKWNHNFRNFKIGGVNSYFYLKEVISVDIDGLIAVPNNQGEWNIWNELYGDSNLYYGIDEKNKNYVLVWCQPNKKVMNTLSIDMEDMTQTSLHQMILPNEVDFPSNVSWSCNRAFGVNPKYAAFYDGRYCTLMDVTMTEDEEEISGVYMCSFNYENSTDVKRLETKYIKNGEETEWDSTFPSNATCPLYKSGCKSFISGSWTIKNNISYVKYGVGADWGFYYKGLMISSVVNDNKIKFVYNTCPYCLSIVEILSRPFEKTLNKTLKYTFRIVNTGGYFYAV